MSKLKELGLRLIAMLVCLYAIWNLYTAIAYQKIWRLDGSIVNWAETPSDFTWRALSAFAAIVFFGGFLVIASFDQKLADAYRAWKQRSR